MKKEINNWEFIFASTKRDSLGATLRIIFQDLEDGNLYLIVLYVDSVMSQILDDSERAKTTNKLMHSIIKKSLHKAILIDDVESIKEYVWSPITYNELQNKIRDIKINQIIR